MDTVLLEGLAQVRDAISACERLARAVEECVARSPQEFSHLHALAETLGIGKRFGWLDNSLFLSDLYLSALQVREAALADKVLSWYCAATLVLLKDPVKALAAVPWGVFPFAPEARAAVMQDPKVQAFSFITAMRQPVDATYLANTCSIFIPLEDFDAFSEQMLAIRLVRRCDVNGKPGFCMHNGH